MTISRSKKQMIVLLMSVLSLAMPVGCSQDTVSDSADAPDVLIYSDEDAGSGKNITASTGTGDTLALDNARGIGTSRSMEGDIMLYCIFVEDSESSWSDEEIHEMYDGVWKDTAYLESQAALYGVYLKFSSAWNLVQVPEEEEDRWYDYLMETVYNSPEHNYEEVQSYFEEMYEVDDMPFLFFFNKEGRCCCYMATEGMEYVPEFAMYYPSTMSDDLSIAHELYHLYGARDLYYPDELKEYAQSYFPDSAMLIGGRNLDELTAYLIGWTDTPGAKAAEFMDKTAHIRQ